MFGLLFGQEAGEGDDVDVDLLGGQAVDGAIGAMRGGHCDCVEGSNAGAGQRGARDVSRWPSTHKGNAAAGALVRLSKHERGMDVSGAKTKLEQEGSGPLKASSPSRKRRGV